jgi:anti-sigma regulatory factor (Ser/Thr protein kinase)
LRERRLRHDAFFFDDDASVAGRLAPAVEEALDEGAAVSVCVSDGLAEILEDALDPTRDRLDFLSADDSYARPITAMGTLWDLAKRNVEAGATAFHAIGEIAFEGDPADARWHWYEAAVSEVLAEWPIVATCLYDERRVPADDLRAALATHPTIVRGEVVEPSPAFDVDRFVPPGVAVPADAPWRSLSDVTAMGPVRRMLEDLPGVLPDTLQRAQLVVSELGANAIRHGGGSAAIDIWIDGGRFVFRVRDRGPGFDARFATIAPPRLETGGAGLWLSHHQSDALSVGTTPGGGTTAVAVVEPR